MCAYGDNSRVLLIAISLRITGCTSQTTVINTHKNSETVRVTTYSGSLVACVWPLKLKLEGNVVALTCCIS